MAVAAMMLCVSLLIILTKQNVHDTQDMGSRISKWVEGTHNEAVTDANCRRRKINGPVD